MLTSRRFTLAAFATLILLTAGCGKASMVPFQGKVTYRGYPLNNGLVVFTPKDRGPMAIGRIRDDGTYALYTGDSPGAYPGHYKITVSSLAPGSSSESWGRFEFPRPAIPDKYRDPDRSGIDVVEVKAGVQNLRDIELTD